VLITYVQYIVWYFVKVENISTQGAASLISLKLDPFCWQAVCWDPDWGRFCLVPGMFTAYFFLIFSILYYYLRKFYAFSESRKLITVITSPFKGPITRFDKCQSVWYDIDGGRFICTRVFYLRACSCTVTLLFSIRLWLLASMNSKRSERKLACANRSSLLPEIAWHEWAEPRKQNSRPLGNLSLYTFLIKTQRNLNILKIQKNVWKL
jgi:hypothetical protein